MLHNTRDIFSDNLFSETAEHAGPFRPLDQVTFWPRPHAVFFTGLLCCGEKCYVRWCGDSIWFSKSLGSLFLFKITEIPETRVKSFCFTLLLEYRKVKWVCVKVEVCRPYFKNHQESQVTILFTSHEYDYISSRVTYELWSVLETSNLNSLDATEHSKRPD